MTTIVAHFFSAADVPLTSPAEIPTVRIRRTDTQALVVTDAAMTEQGDGGFAFDFAPVDGLEYSIRADGDPTASGQTVRGGRYVSGSVSGTEEARIEIDIPAIVARTQANVKQAWTRAITPNSILRGVLSLELEGLQIVLPGSATLDYTIRDAAGSVLEPLVSGVTPNGSGYFSVTVDPFTPAAGTVIVVDAVITNGAAVYPSLTKLSIPEF